jgi:hypothetical protein
VAAAAGSNGSSDVKQQQQQHQQQRRVTQLRLLVMSATLDAGAFSRYFDGAKCLWVRGRTHPVKVFNTAQPENNYLDAALCATLQVNPTWGVRGGCMVWKVKSPGSYTAWLRKGWGREDGRRGQE